MRSHFSRREVVLGGGAAALALSACSSNPSPTTENNTNASNSSAASNSSEVSELLPFERRISGTQIPLGPRGLPTYIDQIGRGFDSVFDDPRAPLVRGTLRDYLVAPTEDVAANQFSFDLIEDQQSYYRFRAMSASAKGRYGAFSAQGGASSQTEQFSNSYSLHVCARAQRFDRGRIIDNSTYAPSEYAAQLLGGRTPPHELLKVFGDSFIASAVPGSSLFIDLRFDTSSQAAKSDVKASVTASYGALASGSGSFQEVINSARGHKGISLTMIGLDGTMVPRTFTAEEVQNSVRRFLSMEAGQSNAFFMSYRPVHEVGYGGRPLGFVGQESLLKREIFVSKAVAYIRWLGLAESDAQYVRANLSEFDAATQDRASTDLRNILEARSAIVGAVVGAKAAFDDRGDDRLFNPARLRSALPVLVSYVQLPPAPPPAPPPPPPPRSEPDDIWQGECRKCP